jgi:hypothetical protein
MPKVFGLWPLMRIYEMRTLVPDLIVDLGFPFFGTQVPEPNRYFEYYALDLSPVGGLGRVTAVGPAIRDDQSGRRTRLEFQLLRSLLQSKYGTGQTFDYLHTGSSLAEAGDWMNALLQNERTLAHIWDFGEHSAVLPPGLPIIRLAAIPERLSPRGDVVDEWLGSRQGSVPSRLSLGTRLNVTYQFDVFHYSTVTQLSDPRGI